MANTGKKQRMTVLERKAAERGTTVEEMVPRLVEQEGSISGAAVALRLPSANYIQRWIDANEYAVVSERRTRLVKKVAPND